MRVFVGYDDEGKPVQVSKSIRGGKRDAERLAAQLASRPAPRSGKLTVAELQTLRCLRDGMTYAEAAAMLNVSVPTIKARLEKVRGKLGAKTATQAVAMAVQRKLL